MALSDEDYGILYNAIGAAETDDMEYLMRNAETIKSSLRTIDCCQGTYQQALDCAAFIILSEERELP
jgi:hypothetical protein